MNWRRSLKIPLYQIDAFTGVPFSGNPAAVCPLEDWLDDALMGKIAAENNLSETAFFVPEGESFHLRWFTPKMEVDLCGHATLAAAHLILDRLRPRSNAVRFETRSGVLEVTRDGDRLTMDFPAWPPEPVVPPPLLLASLGGDAVDVLAVERDYIVVFDAAATVRNLKPHMAGLSDLDRYGVIVTAPGQGCDYVCRFFAPSKGVPEDPVTGSAQCSLVPYWAGRLGKDDLCARQLSARGGELFCKNQGDRVRISGHAVFYMEGTIVL